jgi:hypothetical protein
MDYYWEKITELSKTLKDSEQRPVTIDLGALKEKFAIKDVVSEGIASDYVYYETDRLRPNWGPGGDLMRFSILHKHGGVYLDSDIMPGQASLLQTAIFDPKPNHSFYVDNNSQDTGQVGSDFLICSKGNPLAYACMKEAEAHYSSNPTYYRDEEGFPVMFDAYCSNEVGSTFRTAPDKTGPGVIRYFIATKKNYFVDYIPTDTRISIRELGCAWVQEKPITCGFEEALAKALRTIEFELTQPGILRLEDHVNDIAGASQMNKKEVTKRLISALEDKKFSYNAVKIVQLTYEFNPVTDFYKKHNLNHKCGYYIDFSQPQEKISDAATWATCPIRRVLGEIPLEGKGSVSFSTEVRIGNILADMEDFLTSEHEKYAREKNTTGLENVRTYCTKILGSILSGTIGSAMPSEQVDLLAQPFIDILEKVNADLRHSSVKLK